MPRPNRGLASSVLLLFVSPRRVAVRKGENDSDGRSGVRGVKYDPVKSGSNMVVESRVRLGGSSWMGVLCRSMELPQRRGDCSIFSRDVIPPCSCSESSPRDDDSATGAAHSPDVYRERINRTKGWKQSGEPHLGFFAIWAVPNPIFRASCATGPVMITILYLPRTRPRFPACWSLHVGITPECRMMTRILRGILICRWRVGFCVRVN